MSMIEDETFDTTVCYGVPLNYLLDNLNKGISELVRVTKKGGTVLVSVNSRWGVIRSLLGKENFDILDFFGRPDYWYIDKVVDTGDLLQHPGVSQPPRHCLPTMLEYGEFLLAKGTK